jgi:3-deoxy-D-manno-octulosonic-acid transferase
VTRRSEGAKPIEVDCLVLDTTGELRDWYAVATVVFVGKSLTVAGGQNPAEPIVAGVPVIFGPRMENFAALAHSLVAADGAVQVDNVLTLDTAVADLLRDQRRRAALVANGRRALSAHHGATARTVALLKQLRRSAGSKLPCKPETSF